MTLDDIFNSNGTIHGQKLKEFKTTDEFKQIISSQECKLPRNEIESIYLFKYNTSPKQCAYCNKNLKFANFKSGYPTKYCGPACEMKTDEGKNKRKQTILQKYGVDNIFKLPACKEKRSQIILQKYGVSSPMKVPEIRDRAIKTRKTKTEESHLYNLLDREWLEAQYKTKSQATIAKELGCAQSTVGVYLNSFGFNTNIHRLKSSLEKEIIEFIKEHLDAPILQSNRKTIGLELDVFIPSHNLAIEMNGLHWHSIRMIEDDVKLKSDYHLNKTLACHEQGIRLLHIMDTEWVEKKELCKSLILSKLNLNERIYARKCKIIDLDNKTGSNFISENHMQDKINGGQYKGLIINDDLVSVMQISKSRFDKTAQWELLRFCNKKFINVIGGFSRLLKSFHLDGTLISYANRRWSDGNLYEKTGFSLLRNTTPNYWYWKKYGILESRHKYQKHKLKDFENYSLNMSESQIMFGAGYSKFYDSGNLVYSITLNNKSK